MSTTFIPRHHRYVFSCVAVAGYEQKENLLDSRERGLLILEARVPFSSTDIGAFRSLKTPNCLFHALARLSGALTEYTELSLSEAHCGCCSVSPCR